MVTDIVCADGLTLPWLVMQTYALRECMLKHRDYYAPVLEEEVSVAVHSCIS